MYVLVSGKDSWRRNEEEPNWLDVSRKLIQTQVTSRAEDCCEVSQLTQVIHLAAAGEWPQDTQRFEGYS